MHDGVHGVAELLGHEGVRVGRGDGGGLLDGAAHDPFGGGQVQLGPVGAQQLHPLGGHVLRHRQDQAIALHRGHQRQADAGVARRRLDQDRLPGHEAPLPLGGLDHRQRGPVLDRAARVELLALAEHLGRAGRRQPPQPHQRRPADAGQDVVVDPRGVHQMKYIVAGATARRTPAASARATKSASVVASSTWMRRSPTSPQTSVGMSLAPGVRADAQQLLQRTAHGAQHVGHRDLRRRARQHVAAVRPATRVDQPGPPQVLQDLLEELERDPLPLGDLLGLRGGSAIAA